MIDHYPHNIEAEENILGGILLDSSAMSRVVDLLTPESFYIEAHGIIYRAAAELYRQDKPTDFLSLGAWLSDRKLIKKVGGQTKLVQLLDRTVSAANSPRERGIESGGTRLYSEAWRQSSGE